jgi:hypothetical protein
MLMTGCVAHQEAPEDRTAQETAARDAGSAEAISVNEAAAPGEPTSEVASGWVRRPAEGRVAEPSVALARGRGRTVHAALMMAGHEQKIDAVLSESLDLMPPPGPT